MSFRARRTIAAPVSTVLADGLACRQPDASSLAAIFEFADDIVSVTDDEVAAAMRLYYSATHNLAEGAGAAPLAAALQRKESLKGQLVGLPHTGGNVDAALFRQVLRQQPSRYGGRHMKHVTTAALLAAGLLAGCHPGSKATISTRTALSRFGWHTGNTSKPMPMAACIATNARVIRPCRSPRPTRPMARWCWLTRRPAARNSIFWRMAD